MYEYYVSLISTILLAAIPGEIKCREKVINAKTLFHTYEYDSDSQLPYFFPFSHGQVKHP
jgi:hypothetical protein